MHHQAQKSFCSIFAGIPQHQKGYLVYVPSTMKIISSYDVVFYESFSSMLAFTSHPYAEAMTMRPYVSYILSDTSSEKKTSDIISFTQFEEGGLLSETCDNAESSDEYEDNSIISLLHSEEEIDAMDS